MVEKLNDVAASSNCNVYTIKTEKICNYVTVMVLDPEVKSMVLVGDPSPSST
jgi:hypothetical protein